MDGEFVENLIGGQIKCVIWDLDETMWDGTLTEDPSIRPRPEIYQVLAALDSRGILNSIASKNDHELAWNQLSRLGVDKYFILPQINWNSKSDSVAYIVEALGFDPSAIAFVDDRPEELFEVSRKFPTLRYFHADAATLFLDMPEFSPVAVTLEASHRREQYQAQFSRNRAQEEYSGPDRDFIAALEATMAIRFASVDDLVRMSELTRRSTQMNATGVVYSIGELNQFVQSSSHAVLVATMEDRFGSQGLVGLMVIEAQPSSGWWLRSIATSCRVLMYGAGTILLTWLCNQGKDRGVSVFADFQRTDRNRMMEIAYRFAGFIEDLEYEPEGDRAGIVLRQVEYPELGTAVTVTGPEIFSQEEDVSRL